MATTLNPYLNFRGRAREAMEFYRSVFGGALTVNTFNEFTMAHTPEEGEWVMHSQLETPAGFVLQASDVPSDIQPPTGSSTEVAVSVSVWGDDGDTLEGYWGALSEGATITQPYGPAPWGANFGMLVDRFGVSWIVNN